MNGVPDNRQFDPRPPRRDPAAELELHAGCDRAVQQLNDELDRLKRAYSFVVAAIDGLRPYQNELAAMKLRGDPTQAGLARAVEVAIAALEGKKDP